MSVDRRPVDPPVALITLPGGETNRVTSAVRVRPFLYNADEPLA